MNLGPFTLDIKEVPESMSKERVLSCLALFEESAALKCALNGSRTRAPQQTDGVH